MSSVAEVIARETELVRGFIDLLDKEQAVLKEGRVADLPALTAAKIPLIEQLNRVESERLQVLNLRSSGGPATMTTWIAQHPNDVDAATHWDCLLQLARQAKHLHAMNAQLLSMHLAYTNELVSTLTDASERPMALYGASGQSVAGSGSRIIDSA